MSQSFVGRVVLVTGSGHGIGRATALRLASLGAIVGVNDLKREFVDKVVKEIAASGGKAVDVTANVSTRDGMRNAVLGLAQRCGRLDVLVNNAAWVRYQAIPDVAPETVDRMVEIGFKAVIWGIQTAAEAMDRERGGAIVNLASVAGIVSAPNSIVYSGIKAGIMGITRAAAAELGSRKIRVNAGLRLPFRPRGRSATARSSAMPGGSPTRRSAGWARSTILPVSSAFSPATTADSSPARP